MTYKELANEFQANPRDVHTVPLDGRTPLWFHVHTEGRVIYATPAERHRPSSRMKTPIPVKASEFEKMLDLYHRRLAGENVFMEAWKTSRAQVYWYGIFNDIESTAASSITPKTPFAEESPFVSAFREIIENVSSAAGRKISSGYEIIDRGVPHAPQMLKPGTMGVYTFLYKDKFLKIGKAGPNSNARFFSQHYLPTSSASNLSKSILNDAEMRTLGITEQSVGNWIKQNTRRIDIILDESLGIFTLELIEAALHFKYEPRYEGFKNQR